MQLTKVKEIILPNDGNIATTFVDKGLIAGGHSAMPDIDTDFASDRRHEIKAYLEERYNTNGKQRVFSAGTFTTMRLKAVLKDVGRVHRVPLKMLNYITSLFEDDKMDWTDLFKLAHSNKQINKFVQDYPQLIEDIQNLMGQARSASIHASAIIVTPDEKDGVPAECFDFLPIRKMDDLLVSEFDGYAIEEVGLLKEDVLATKELTKLSSTISLVNERYGKGLSIEHIVQNELEDHKTYDLLSAGYTQNVFQFSSSGITRFIMDVQPDCIEDLIAINALYRPATLEIGATEDYIRFKHGEVEPEYNYGTYEATKNTFGIMTYQEQFMSIAHTLGGFDLGKTDYLRKAIGKKNAELMATLKVDFINGAIKNGCPKQDAEEIWHKIELAGKYSFNRSHAAAYALTAYCGAWLKANYPLAFYTVALQWANEKDIASLMFEMELCSDAKIVPPDINISESHFFTDFDTDRIFWSLSRIKNLGTKSVDYILTERKKRGKFTSIQNFIHRIFKYKLQKYQYWDDPQNPDEAERSPVNIMHVRHLVLSGCFDFVENVQEITERLFILEKAAVELGLSTDTNAQFQAYREQFHFWAIQQINLCGIGKVDYQRIYDQSEAKKELKGKGSYMHLKEALDINNENKKVIACATVIDIWENTYKDKMSGEKKYIGKLRLQQNNEIIELTCWDDTYRPNRAMIQGMKDKIIVLNCVIKYSDYSGCNTLSTYKSSKLFIV